MLLGITDIKGNTIIDNTIVKTIIERQIAYGNPLELNVGLSINVPELKVGNSYVLVFDDLPNLTLTLYASYSDYIDDKEIQYYTFVYSPFDKILKNEIPVNSSIMSIKFDKYIIGLKKQLKYFTQELRKKGLILILDNEYMPKQVHLMTATFNLNKIDKNVYSVKEIEAKKYRHKAYYTFNDKQVLYKTKNNIDLPAFIPFHNSQDIQGLSNYLLPKYELFTEYSNYKIGDKIEINNEKCVVMEKEVFVYLGKYQTHIILGVLQNA